MTAVCSNLTYLNRHFVNHTPVGRVIPWLRISDTHPFQHGDMCPPNRGGRKKYRKWYHEASPERKARGKRRITLSAIAEATGICRSVVADYESGRNIREANRLTLEDFYRRFILDP